jgi:hypothetical protein
MPPVRFSLRAEGYYSIYIKYLNHTLSHQRTEKRFYFWSRPHIDHIEKKPALYGALLFYCSNDTMNSNYLFNKEIILKPLKTTLMLSLALMSFTSQANDVVTLKKNP